MTKKFENEPVPNSSEERTVAQPIEAPKSESNTQQTINPETLKSDLREALLAYREKRPSLSLRAIARNSGVNRYFLNKILEASSPKDNSQLDFNQVLIISNFLSQKDLISEQKGAKRSESNSTSESHFGLKKKFEIQNEKFPQRFNLYEKRVFIILLLASSGLGTNRAQVRHVLGAQGLQMFDQLLRQDILANQGDWVKISAFVNFELSSDLIQHHLGHLSDCLSNHTAENRTNYIDLKCQSVNAETFQMLKEIYEDTQARVEKLLNKKKCQGDIKFFGYVCMDHFMTEDDDHCESDQDAP